MSYFNSHAEADKQGHVRSIKATVSLADQPYYSYVYACAYDKWAGGICAEKYVWALSTGFRATEICAEFSCGQLTRAWNLLEQAISFFF